jgi:hypothetical protein
MNIQLTSKEYKSNLSVEQLESLVSFLLNPSIIALPEGKTFGDVKKIELEIDDEVTRVDRMGSKAAQLKIEFK